LLPEGRLLKFLGWYGTGAMIVLVLWMLGFMVEQARFGLYPQLQRPWLSMGQNGPAGSNSDSEIYQDKSTVATDMASGPDMAAAMMEKASAKRYQSEKPALEPVQSGSRQYMDQVDPALAAQTGPGVPSWEWQQIYLQWSGPVTSQEQLTVWLMSPTESRFLNGLRVLCGLLLLMAIVGFKRHQGKWEIPSRK
jgi:hypothetical protein